MTIKTEKSFPIIHSFSRKQVKFYTLQDNFWDKTLQNSLQKRTDIHDFLEPEAERYSTRPPLNTFF